EPSVPALTREPMSQSVLSRTLLWLVSANSLTATRPRAVSSAVRPLPVWSWRTWPLIEPLAGTRRFSSASTPGRNLLWECRPARAAEAARRREKTVFQMVWKVAWKDIGYAPGVQEFPLPGPRLARSRQDGMNAAGTRPPDQGGRRAVGWRFRQLPNERGKVRLPSAAGGRYEGSRQQVGREGAVGCGPYATGA